MALKKVKMGKITFKFQMSFM